jgi:hypothetical protein
VILDVNGLKQQAIYIVNPMTVEVNPIALTTIPADVRSLYVKQKTNEDGSKVLSTNNFTYINEQYIDFKEVSAFVVNNIGSKIPIEAAQIEVTTQNALNTYKITTTTNSVIKTVIVTSDTTTKTQYLVDYQENILVPVIQEKPYVAAPTTL